MSDSEVRPGDSQVIPGIAKGEVIPIPPFRVGIGKHHSSGGPTAIADKRRESPPPVTDAPRQTPTWLTLCISTYPEDLAALDAMVAQCTRAGIPKMSRSRLMRIALKRLDLEQVIRELRGVR